MRPLPCGNAIDGGPALFAFPGFGFAFAYACLIHIVVLYWGCTGKIGRGSAWLLSSLGPWSLADVVRAVNLVAIGYLLTYVPLLAATTARRKRLCWCFLVAAIALVLAVDVYVSRAAWLSAQPLIGF